MNCSTSLAKIILFIFNVAFFIFGVASLGLGIWVVVNKSDLFRFINLMDSKVTSGSNEGSIETIANQNGMVTLAGYVLIGIGVFTLVVGFCGCCGAMKESKCLLMIYAALVGLILIIEIVAAIMAAVFQNRIRATAEDAMLALQDKFFVAMPDYLKQNANKTSNTTASTLVTFLINNLQVMFDCCGAQDLGDIANSTSWTASNRMWNGKQLKVPLTCCRVKPELKNSVMNPVYNWSQITGDLQDANCPFSPVANNTGLNSKTCYSSIIDYVQRYAGPLIGICVGIGLFELLGILFACCLIRAVENDVSYAKQ